MRVCSKRTSKFLYDFRIKSPYFRGKARFFRWFRRLTGHPRLIIPYGEGWISVDDEGEAIERTVWHQGIHEAEVWNALAAYADKGEVFWDIGANIGTVAIQGLLDSRVHEVHCFEPNPVIAAILEMNLHLNSGKYAVHQVALGDVVGEANLYWGTVHQSDVATLDKDRGFGHVQVSCTTVDRVIESGVAPPTLLKLDVEGWEEKVLIGARHLLVLHPPKAIVFEAEADSSGRILNENLLKLLENSGYRITWIRRTSGKLHQYEGKYLENYVAALQGITNAVEC